MQKLNLKNYQIKTEIKSTTKEQLKTMGQLLSWKLYKEPKLKK